MSQYKKIYHWANVIIIPLMIILVLTVSSDNSNLIYIAYGWILVSGLLNEKLRNTVAGSFAKFFGGLFASTAWVSCFTGGAALFAGLIILIIVFTLLALVGFVVFGGYLFFTSARALYEDYQLS